MNPRAASLLLASAVAAMGAACTLHPTAFRPPRATAPRRDLLPTAADLDRIEAAAARRAARNAKRVRSGQRGGSMLWLMAYVAVAVVVVSGMVDDAKNRPRDSTDAPSGERSGMVIRVDALTGCQYLADGRGGLAPRLGPDGRPLCGAGVPR